MQLPSKLPDWLSIALLPPLAAVGGALGYVMRALNADIRISWSRALFESFAAGFVGVLVLLLCQELGLGLQATGLCVGVCGWLGANATIQLLSRIALPRLGVPPKEVADDEQQRKP